MIRLIRWLLGYVSFEFTKGFADGFVNSCFESGVNVHSLKRCDSALIGECSARSYPALHRLALKNGGVVKITKKHGIIFTLLKLRNRWGLFAGALAFVIIVSFLSGFIWNIEIVGNEKISDSEVSAFLEENRLVRGAYWKSIDKNKIQNLMMASFDDCAWVHINELGTTARIEINETIDKPEVVNKSSPANLKAKKDGIIVRATVYDGWAAANKGDSVTKGDLLISGIYESEKKKTNQFTHARGEYIAQVKEPFSLTVNREQGYKSYTDETHYKTINFFGINLPLYFVKWKEQNCDIKSSAKYIKLNSNELPIGITTTTVKSYVPESRKLSDKELTELCRAEIEKKLKKDFESCEIIKKDISVSLGEGSAMAKGSVLCLENIGEEVKIKIKK